MKKQIHHSLIFASTFALLSMPAVAMSASNMVKNVSLSPATPNLIKGGQNVTVRFSYETTEAGGVRIWARPFTDNNLTVGYAACGSPLYAFPSGTGTCTFTINSTNTNVDNIRFQMYNADQSTKLFEGFIPVNYKFR